MEMYNEIVTLISSVGFPIVCCFFLWKFINTTLADFTTNLKENTRMLEKLCDRLDFNLHVYDNKEGDDLK